MLAVKIIGWTLIVFAALSFLYCCYKILDALFFLQDYEKSMKDFMDEGKK